ncbi:hypothetical protein HPP92_000941 [Vanilla planifolia]|uniref:Transcription repressor n=1 Tax=Vanilla planifolia TaxID=51239 RepID=A0A835RZ07_VANPL|nr:hypothetical protein HPP92_000941 [Vanilla planifolia]
MSSSRHRRFSTKHPVSVVDVGCSCRLSKLSSLFSSLHSKPRFPKPPDSVPFSSSSAAATSLLAPTSTTGMVQDENAPSPAPTPREKDRRRRRRRRSRRTMTPATESVAVVKETSEPYADFRESMVQMIVEEELYAWDDLNELLHRFLTLNSPRHHHLILHAFADLWSGVFSPPSPCRLDNYC